MAEVSRHRSKFVAATSLLAIEVDLRCYIAQVQEPLVDVRHMAEIHDPDSYATSREFAKAQRAAGVSGLLYRCSVRDPARGCVAVFPAPAIKVPVTQDRM